MTEDRLKQLSKIPDLELQQEFQEMFRIAWDDRYAVPLQDQEIIGRHLNDVIMSVGKAASIYSMFLDKVEQHTLQEITEKDRIKYLYEFNFTAGVMIRQLIDLTLFSKLNNQDIHNGFIKLTREHNVESLISSQQLDSVMSFARYVNIQQQVYNNPDVNLRPSTQYQAQADFDLPANEIFLQAGKIVNQSFLLVYHRHVFNILMCCYELHRSLELEEIKLDSQVYGEKVLQLWVNVFAMLDGLGHDWNSIQRIYAVTQYKYAQGQG